MRFVALAKVLFMKILPVLLPVDKVNAVLTVEYIITELFVNVLFWDDKPLSLELPPKVTLVVRETDPGVKGNSASNVYKSATLENDLRVRVALFVNKGQKIRVDTRTGEYVEKAN